MKSVLNKVIADFISYKRSLGFKYEDVEYKFNYLEKCANNYGLNEVSLPKELVENFVRKRDYEKQSNIIKRVWHIRELAKYMANKGYDAYIIPPLQKGSYKREFIPYIFTDDELVKLFRAVDEWSKSPSLDHQYYSERKKYPLILRILYSTGMRISEVLALKLRFIDFENNTFTILNAKNNSERIIPVNENIILMIKQYVKEEDIFLSDDYIFKGDKKNSHLDKSTVDYHFQNFLRMANIPHPKDGPRIHSFRHTFCVHRLKLWVLEGKDINALFPYLCAYMGHADTRCTEYYLRLTADLYPDIVYKSELYLYGENNG